MRSETRRLRWLVAALLVSGLLNLTFVGTALFWRCMRQPTTVVATAEHRSGTGMTGPLLAELALQPDQVARIAQRRTETAARIAEARRSSGEARGRLWALAAAGPDRRAELERELDGVASAQRRVQEQVLEYLLWLRSQLTPVQRQSFDQVMAQRMCRCPSCDGGCLDGCPHGTTGHRPAGAVEHGGNLTAGSVAAPAPPEQPTCGGPRSGTAAPACGCQEQAIP